MDHKVITGITDDIYRNGPGWVSQVMNLKQVVPLYDISIYLHAIDL